jgi:hypothetical protein
MLYVINCTLFTSWYTVILKQFILIQMGKELSIVMKKKFITVFIKISK